jgi:hypothetical protein
MIENAINFISFLPNWNSLDSVRRVHSDLEFAAIIFFALLAFFDVLAHLSEDKKKEKILEKIGLTFFALAVLAEFVAYPYGQRNDTLSANIIGSLDVKASDAESKAESAVSDFQKANRQLGEIDRKAGAISGRLDVASANLDRLVGTVQQQGPRWKLLESGKSEVIKELKPLGGQKVFIVYCGWELSAPWEPEQLAGGLTFLFNEDLKSGWHGDLTSWRSCPPNGPFDAVGNMIFVSAEAPEPTKRAARTLSVSLNKIGIDTGELQEVQMQTAQVTSVLFGPGSPWELAVKNPSSIVLFVGTNPMQGPRPPNNTANKPRTKP